MTFPNRIYVKGKPTYWSQYKSAMYIVRLQSFCLWMNSQQGLAARPKPRACEGLVVLYWAKARAHILWEDPIYVQKIKQLKKVFGAEVIAFRWFSYRGTRKSEAALVMPSLGPEAHALA